MPIGPSKQRRIVSSGDTFGRWTVLEECEIRKRTNAAGYERYYSCRCLCGNVGLVPKNALISRASQSCGCLRQERAIAATRKHGMWRTRTYRAWQAMVFRCHKTWHKQYHSYGGRGILVCERWHEFENFLADMGIAPEGLEIDRVDNNKGYEPTNCRWATRFEQMANTRKTNHVVVEGKHLCLKSACRLTKIAPGSVYYRMTRWGETTQMALNHLIAKKGDLTAELSRIQPEMDLRGVRVIEIREGAPG